MPNVVNYYSHTLVQEYLLKVYVFNYSFQITKKKASKSFFSTDSQESF